MHKPPLKSSFITFIGLCFFSVSLAQESGPIIADYGKVWKLDNLDFKTDTSNTFRAVFDVAYSPKDKSQLNGSINTAARFLNMHAQNGVPLAQLKVALVIHGDASKDLLTSETYKAKYGVDNPNEKLLQDLMDVGVEIMFCGQTFKSKGFLKEELIDKVQLSLSAMTALIQLQDNNYRQVF